MSRPNILFVMTDQQRIDTVAALGRTHIYTPHLDRPAKRGIALRIYALPRSSPGRM